MSGLGDFLEAVFGATDRFQTVHASIRHWHDRRVAEDIRRVSRTMIGRRKVGIDEPVSTVESHLSVWLALPDKVRVEISRRKDDELETSTEIVNGAESWQVDQEGHVEVGRRQREHASSFPTHVDRHFNRRLLREFFVGLNLEQIGCTRAANCDCVRIKAVARPDARLWPHWLPSAADEFEFHADPTRGLLLSIIARRGAEVFAIYEVTDAEFDQPLDEQLFRYTPLGGEQIRERDPIVVRMTLEAAVGRMSFTVLVPTRLPDPDHSQLEVMYHPSRIRSPRDYLSLMYRGSQAYDHLWINQGASSDPDLEKFEWEPVIGDGKDMRISDPGADGGRIIAFEQHGTQVVIWSDVAREPLVDMARSFVPANRCPQ